MALSGGRSSTLSTENFRYFLTKPYELVWPPSPEQWAQMDEMFIQLYDAGRYLLTALEEGEVIDDVTGEADAGDEATTPDVRTATVVIGSAQLEAIDVTPVEIVEAPESDEVIVVLNWSHRTVKGTTAWTSSPTLRLQYTGDTTQLCTTVVIGLTGNGSPPFGDSGDHTENQWSSGGGFDTRGKAVEVFGTTASTRGAGATATSYITVVYYIISTNDNTVVA